MAKVFRAPIILLALMPSSVFAYDRTAAVNYAQTWYSTSLGTDNKANHINNPLSKNPGTGKFLWYNSFGPPNVGDDTIGPDNTIGNTLGVGEDCANFVSAALSSGGISLPLSNGAGNTVTLASRLACELRGNSAAATQFTNLSQVPGDLIPGDVVVFHGLATCHGSYHAMIVVGGSGPNAILAAHSDDRNAATLGGELSYFCSATAYHINSDNPGYCLPANVIFQVADPVTGNTLSSGSFTNAQTAVVSGPTIADLALLTGSPSLNSDIDAVSGLSTVIADYGASLVDPSYNVDLSPLSDGATAYFMAYDANGNVGVQSLHIDRTPPACSLGPDSVTCSDSGSGLCQMTLNETTISSGSFSLGQNFSPSVSSNTIPFNLVPQDGNYTITAVDCAGNSATFPPAGQPPSPINRDQKNSPPPGYPGPISPPQGGSPVADLPINSIIPPFPENSQALLPGDPNEMFGPSGQVSPGQALSYVAQFENTGQGTAYGVYVTDVLDPNLDDTTLSVGNFQAINFVAGSTVSTTWPFKYDPTTRTVVIMPGTIRPSQGGQMTISAKVKAATRRCVT